MSHNSPRVTIAIPTYNRAGLLVRSISSAQQQTYDNISIVIADNGSTDNTESLCHDLVAIDSRIRYFRHPENLGSTYNFNWLLSECKGDYFMWLGDDDWIDSNYVQSCLKILMENSSLSFASGVPIYYKKGIQKFIGRIFDVAQTSAKQRIARYLSRVTDNGVFYGLFRRNSVQGLQIPDTFGGDWYFLCDVLAVGGFRMTTETHVHRELGGATESYKKLTRLYGLSSLASFFPSYYVCRAFRHHMAQSQSLVSLHLNSGYIGWLSVIILTRPLFNVPYRVKQKFQSLI